MPIKNSIGSFSCNTTTTMTTAMFQTKKTSNQLDPNSFPLQNSGVKYNTTQIRFDTVTMPNHQHLGAAVFPLRRDKHERKRSLEAAREVSVANSRPVPAEKRRRALNVVVPRGFGQSIPLKKASWWKTGGDFPKRLIQQEESPRKVSPPSCSAASRLPTVTRDVEIHHQNAAFVSSDSLRDWNQSANLARRHGHQDQTRNNHNNSMNNNATSNIVAANMMMINEFPAADSTADISNFVRQTSAAGKQQMIPSAARPPPLQNLDDLLSRPRSISFGKHDNTISPILTLLHANTKSNKILAPTTTENHHHHHHQQKNPSSQQAIVDDDAASNDAASTSADSGELNFRAYQAENWTEKFEELIEFRQRYGHCLVPNAFPQNTALAQWVKRQRYQYKLKLENMRSTMSDERVHALEEIGFIWDSHRAIWDERLHELMEYKQMTGHCNVPSRYTTNRQLAIWVKRQRRQYKFYTEDKPSSMTPERIHRLEAIGFEWDLRKRNDEDDGSETF